MEHTLGASAEAAEVQRRTVTDNAPNIRATQKQTDHVGPKPWLKKDARGRRYSLLEARDREYVAVVETQKQELQELLLKMKEDERALIEALRKRREQQQESAPRCVPSLNEDGATSPSEPEPPLWERCQEVEKYVQLKKQEYMKKFMTRGKAMGATFNAAKDRAIQAQLTRYTNIEVRKEEGEKLKKHVPNVKRKISSLRTQNEEMQTVIKKQNESLEKKKHRLNRLVQNRENHQKRSIQRALLSAIQYERMWLTQEEEARELLERAQNLDEWIYEHVLHQPQETPDWVFPKPGRCQDPGATERTTVEAPSSVARLAQILCEGAGFLMEVEEVVEADGRTLVKRGYMFETLGIKENNVEKFLHFLQQYEPRDESHAPGAGAPGAGAPGAGAPGAGAPGAGAPGAGAPGAGAPGAGAPGTTAPGTGAPGAGAPGATVTGARAPGATVPETTVPGTTVPETTVPGATVPETTVPGAVCSSGPAAVTSVPSERHEVLQAVTSFLNQRLRGRRRRRVTSLQVIRDPDYWDRVEKVIPEESMPKMQLIQKELQQRYAALKESTWLSKQVQSLELETTQLQMARMRLQDPQDPQEQSGDNNVGENRSDKLVLQKPDPRRPRPPGGGNLELRQSEKRLQSQF